MIKYFQAKHSQLIHFSIHSLSVDSFLDVCIDEILNSKEKNNICAENQYVFMRIFH